MLLQTPVIDAPNPAHNHNHNPTCTHTQPHLEGVQLHVWREAGAGCVLAADDACHKAAVAQAVAEALLVRPVGALLDVADVRVALTDAGVKHAHLGRGRGGRVHAQMRRQQQCVMVSRSARQGLMQRAGSFLQGAAACTSNCCYAWAPLPPGRAPCSCLMHKSATSALPRQ